MIPNHILILGSPNSGKLRIANLISKNEEIPNLEDVESHSGLIVKTSLRTKYYFLKLNILIDEYSESKGVTDEKKLSELHKWYQEFKSEEFGELREVLDGLMFTINMKTDSISFIGDALEIIEQIKISLGDEENFHDWGGFIAVVGSCPENQIVEDDLILEIEDMVLSHGLEFINLSTEGENEYKEKQGKDRIVELIESHDWTNLEMLKVDSKQYETNKLAKMESMKQKLINEKEELDLDDIFSKLNLARDHAQSLTQDERDKYANKVIEEIIDFL
ncbi:increased recombination centers protein 6 [Candida albicans P75063]|nr:increased recombination centers protein 6 [Candida albicans P75063]